MYTCYIQSFKILASFCSSAGWFESYPFENPWRHIFTWCDSYELPHDKTTKMTVRPAKTQISLCICPFWSASSLSAWRNLRSLATNWVHREDSDQTGWMTRLIWVFSWRTATLLVLSWCGSCTNGNFALLYLPSFCMKSSRNFALLTPKSVSFSSNVFMCDSNCSIFACNTLADSEKENKWAGSQEKALWSWTVWFPSNMRVQPLNIYSQSCVSLCEASCSSSSILYCVCEQPRLWWDC